MSSTSSSWSSRMKSRRRLERRSLNWSRSMAVSMARKTSGPRMSAKESLRSLASQRSSSLLAVCWLMRRARVSLSCSILPSWMSRPANSRQSLAETALRVLRSTSCQCSGLAALNDSRARRCLAAGSAFHQRAELRCPATRWPARPVRLRRAAARPICADVVAGENRLRAPRPAGCAGSWESRR